MFGVLFGKLLGFIVSSWGIEANPTKAINNTVEYEALIHGLRIAVTLGIIVSSRGIEANPTKVNAIRFMKPPRSKKDLMKLTGCMAALSRFIS